MPGDIGIYNCIIFFLSLSFKSSLRGTVGNEYFRHGWTAHSRFFGRRKSFYSQIDHSSLMPMGYISLSTRLTFTTNSNTTITVVQALLDYKVAIGFILLVLDLYADTTLKYIAISCNMWLSTKTRRIFYPPKNRSAT